MLGCKARGVREPCQRVAEGSDRKENDNVTIVRIKSVVRFRGLSQQTTPSSPS